MAESMGLTKVLETVSEDTDDDDLTAEEVVDALESRGYGPLLLVPAMLTVLPTGTIPGVPTATALLLLFIAPQILIGRKSPWLPQFLAQRSIEKSKFDSAIEKAKPYTKWFDKLLQPRLDFFVSDTAVRVIAGLCVVLALALPPLEFIPGLAFVPAFTIALFAIGLSAEDGLFVVAGLIALVVGSVAGYFIFF